MESLGDNSDNKPGLGGLRQFHSVHWIVLLLSVVITLAAWSVSSLLLAEGTEQRFEREANQVVTRIITRLSRYEDALLAGRATMVNYDGKMDRQQWRQYADSLELGKRYPGVNGIGIIRGIKNSKLDAFEAEQRQSRSEFTVFPEHEFPLKLPIVFVEPEQVNASAIGLDVAFEQNRRVAALRARDSNTTQISGPISLVQDDSKTPGVLFYVPYFLQDGSFDGFVYAPLVIKNLVAGGLSDLERHVKFSIRDSDSLLYDDSVEVDANSSQHIILIEKKVFGRVWEFTIVSAPAFFAESKFSQPLLVLLSGLTVDAMLFILFLMLTRANSKVSSLATDLRDQASVLEEKNGELESFAYVVSHDLKTPIRAIHSLAGFLEEDLDDVMPCEDTKAPLKSHITKINEQTVRSEALIQGILEFSVAGLQSESLESVDVVVMIKEIAESLEMSGSQVTIASELPALDACAVRLRQVLENLIGNAYKYHPTPEAAEITISCESNSTHHRFFVADNGLGIEPKYHERIFKPFTTLQVSASPDSSGIGLSIVRKSLERIGGSVGVMSGDQGGAVFYFDWPIVSQQHLEAVAHAA